MDKYHKIIWISRFPSTLVVETSPEPISSRLGLAGLPNIIPDKKTLMDGFYNLAYQFLDDDDEPYANTPYTGVNKRTGEGFNGVTDEDGWSERFHSDSEDEIEVHLKLDWQNNHRKLNNE